MQEPIAETQLPKPTDALDNTAPEILKSAGERSDSELVKNGESSKPQLSLEDSLLQRVSTIKEGDNVLLRLPSDMVKAIVASEHG